MNSKLTHESRGGSVRINYQDHGRYESVIAFFGFSLVQHSKDEHGERTTLAVPSTTTLTAITTHTVNDGAVLTFTGERGERIDVNLTGLTVEALRAALDTAVPA